jgi:transposase
VVAIQPPFGGAHVWHIKDLVSRREGGRSIEDNIIGVRLAKRIFQLHSETGFGNLLSRQGLTRDQFREFMSCRPPSSVVLEACGTSSYWAHEMQAIDFEVRVIGAQSLKPFVRIQKDDATDAEAIVVAACQSELRFSRRRAKSSKRAQQSSEPVSAWCVNELS